jgi:hypothetical protein
LEGTFGPQRLSDEQDVISRTLQFTAAFMAVAASAEAQGDEPATTANPADTASIILASKPTAAVQPPAPGPDAGNQPGSLAGTTDPSSTMPGYSPASTSSYISAAIAAGLPAYDPSRKAIDKASAGTSPDGRANQATSGIALLPAYIVRDVKIPDQDQILTYKGKAKIAMNKYIGPYDGLDRGVLNRYTLQELWQKIPILGALPFVGTPAHMSNEARGFDAAGANDTLPYPHPPPKAVDGSDDVK